MKSVTIALTVVTLSLATFVVSDNLLDHEACLKQADVTENEIFAFFQGDKKPADTKDNVKCYFMCTLEMQGFWKDGKLLEEPTIKSLRDSPQMKENPNMEQIYYDCKDEAGVNDCDKAFKVMQCFVQHKFHE